MGSGKHGSTKGFVIQIRSLTCRCFRADIEMYEINATDGTTVHRTWPGYSRQHNLGWYLMLSTALCRDVIAIHILSNKKVSVDLASYSIVSSATVCTIHIYTWLLFLHVGRHHLVPVRKVVGRSMARARCCYCEANQ